MTGVSLREVFTPLITYVLLFLRTPKDRQRSFADLRRDVRRLLDEQQALVKRHDVAAPDYDSARFAAVAWLDEAMLRGAYASNRDVYDNWKRLPLQVELYNTANAGEEFFERLAALGPTHDAIREIYHLCLCLGFRGRYYDDTQTYKLVELRRQMAQHLPLVVPDLLEIDKKKERVTPQPYEAQAPPAKRMRSSLSPLWAVLALGLAAACVAVVWYWTRPPARRPQSEIVADLQQRLSHFTCWHLDKLDFHDQQGLLSLAGRVESDEQRQLIRAAAKGVPEVTDVQDAFAVIGRPFCEVLDVLEPFEARAQATGANLVVRPQKGCDTTYHRAENLVMSVSEQKPLLYVYVDYYVADRQTVAHLLPNPKQPDNSLPTAKSISIGDPGGDTQWQVEPPFGMEMMTVISSPQPLFGQVRVLAEGVSPYLDDLRRVLPNAGASTEVIAAHCLITTEDR